MDIELHQFAYSPYNEKARWALAHKGLKHRRHNYLPGPHMRPIRRLSGQTQTPVATIDGHVIAGSAAIVEALERLRPDPPLLPADPQGQADALAWQARLDAELGPSVRIALFSVMLDEGGYFCRLFSEGKPAPLRWAYRASYPLAKGLIRRGNGLSGPEAVRQAFATAEALCDDIAGAVEGTGYLVGDRFTVADLTAAALLAPAVNPPDSEMCRPEPMPAAVRGFLAHWADHPAAVWTRRIYADHRPGTGTY